MCSDVFARDPQHDQQPCVQNALVLGEFADVGAHGPKQFVRLGRVGAFGGVLRDGLDFEPERFFKRNSVGVACRQRVLSSSSQSFRISSVEALVD